MAVSYADMMTSVRTLFNTQWTALNPTIPIVADNMLGNDPPQSADKPYVVIFHQPATALQVASSNAPNRRYRQIGLIIVQIFVPVAEGDNRVHQLVDNVISIWRGITTNGVIFMPAPFPRRIGRVDSHFHVDVLAPYRFDVFA